MHFPHWLSQKWTLLYVTLPGWAWCLAAAVLGAGLGLAAYAIVTVRARTFAADHELTQAFLTEAREHAESAQAPQDGPTQQDDLYAARPQVRPAADSAGNPSDYATRALVRLPSHDASIVRWHLAGSDSGGQDSDLGTESGAGPAQEAEQGPARGETALERLTRAEDALVAVCDWDGFLAWLERDRADYEAARDQVDAMLATGVWASTPWLAAA